METFRVTIEIALREEGPFRQAEAWVDTGAFYTWLPASILEDLGVKGTANAVSFWPTGALLS